MRLSRYLAILGLVCAALCPPIVAAQELRVAAAADLKFALDELASEYKEQSGITIAPTYGSSGNFFVQIQNGAPFDVFLSADVDYPQKLQAAGFTDPGTLQKYAAGRIVLWMRSDSEIDPRLGWKALLDERVKQIAIANPDHAPYGRAALAAIRTAGIYDQIHTRLVYGENISQAAQFVQSGNADAGVIALSLAVSPAMRSGKRWDIPSDTYPRIEQAAVVLRTARYKSAARSFLAFLKSGAARAILERYGFDTSSSPANASSQP